MQIGSVVSQKLCVCAYILEHTKYFIKNGCLDLWKNDEIYIYMARICFNCLNSGFSPDYNLTVLIIANELFKHEFLAAAGNSVSCFYT